MASLAATAPDSLPVTPGTRSEAEAAFRSNSLNQTSSAGAAYLDHYAAVQHSVTGRPPFPTRSSHNYADATASAVLNTVDSNESNRMPSLGGPNAQLAARPKGIRMPTSPSDDDLAAQNAAAERAWMNEQAAAKRSSADMRSDSVAESTGQDVPKFLAAHGRQQSWNAQDLKRQMQEPLMKGQDEGVAYGYSGHGGGVTGE